jgi:hypothetical protein
MGATKRHGSIIRAFTEGQIVLINKHYPPGDIRDPKSGTQCYYHCHRDSGEHGHIHVFGRCKSIGYPIHLFAISLDEKGLPIALFTISRCAGGGSWLTARETTELAKEINLGNAGCDQDLAGWLETFSQFYSESIALLLEQRDRNSNALSTSENGRYTEFKPPLDDTSQEVLSYLRIDWEKDVSESERKLGLVCKTKKGAKPNTEDRGEQCKKNP